MQTQVQSFMFQLDTARIRIMRMMATGQLRPEEEANFVCLTDTGFVHSSNDFWSSMQLEPTFRIKPKAHLQADLVIEAKEILELLNSAYVAAYDLFEYDMRNTSARHLDTMIACMASTLKYLPKFIEDRSRALRTAERPVYFIAGHGGLCSMENFVVPRGCTVVVLTPPGGVAYARVSDRFDGFLNKFGAKFVEKVRKQSLDFDYYAVYYNEGSVMQDQVVEFSGHGDVVEGLYKIPFSRLSIRNPKSLLGDVQGEIRISCLVGSQGPGIYVVHTCRRAATMNSFKETLQRDKRVQKNRTDVPRHLDIRNKSVNLSKCMRMSEYGKLR
jgi:hypothetical protein